MGDLKNCMGSRQIVLVSTAGISVLNAGIFWREAKTKRLFSQCLMVLIRVFKNVFFLPGKCSYILIHDFRVL